MSNQATICAREYVFFGMYGSNLPGYTRLLTYMCNTFPDAVLAARTSMFSLLNFKAVFGLAFARICVSLLQAVVAFHDMQMRTETDAKERRLEACIFTLAVFKIIACYTVRSSCSNRRWWAIIQCHPPCTAYSVPTFPGKKLVFEPLLAYESLELCVF